MPTTEHTRQMIENILQTEFSPSVLQVIDDSYAHRGHAAATAGHVKVTMVSALFRNMRQIARHRLVYEKLGDLMTSSIHALSLTLRADNEA